MFDLSVLQHSGQYHFLLCYFTVDILSGLKYVNYIVVALNNFLEYRDSYWRLTVIFDILV